jgi:hypothetical protein
MADQNRTFYQKVLSLQYFSNQFFLHLVSMRNTHILRKKKLFEKIQDGG